MNIKVLSEKQIENFKTDKTHIVISIRSPKTSQANLPKSDSRIGTLFLEFSDLDSNYIGLMGTKLFTQEDARAILLFVNSLKEMVDLVVCQCEAGISRSAGVAGALSRIFNGKDEYFFKNYLPNHLVYSTILKVWNEENYE